MGMKADPNAKKTKKHGRVSLLTSMLVIFIAALAASISLTVILFSVMGRSVYAKVVAKDMAAQAGNIAEETLNYLNGDISEDNYRFMMRAGDAEVVTINSMLEPLQGGDPGPGDMMPDKPGGGEPPQGNPGGHFEEYLGICRALYPEVVADPYLSSASLCSVRV